MSYYRRLLSVPGAASIFLGVLVVRGATIASDFALFWIADDLSDSLALAGLAMGAVYLGVALGNPPQGKLSDRFGVKKVLLLCGFIFLLLGALPLLLSFSWAYLLLLAFLLGAFRPSGQGFGRASWQILYDSKDDRLGAASLDSIQSASVNGLAALLAVFLAQIINPTLVLLLAALLASGGAFSLAFSPVATKLLSKQEKSQVSSVKLLRQSSFCWLLATQTLFFVADGALVIVLLALAKSWGEPQLGGVLIAIFLIGALRGSFVFGKKASEHQDRSRTIKNILPGYALSLALFLPALLWAPLIIPALLLAGYSRRGFTPSLQLLTQEIAPLKQINEALALVVVALVIGSGIGRSLAGPAEAISPTLMILLPAAATLLTFLAAAILHRKLSQAPSLPGQEIGSL